MRKPNVILTGALLGLSTSTMAFLSMERTGTTLPASAQNETTPVESVLKAPMAKLAQRNIASGLYVYSIGGNNGCPVGLFSTDIDGTMTHLWSPDFESEGWHMFNGWMYNGHLTGFIQHQTDGAYDGIKLIEQDFETGEVIDSRSLDASDYNTWFLYCDYIPEKEVIFGVGRDEKNWDALKTMNINDLNDINNICTVYYDYLIVALAYNPYDQKVYAVTRQKEFVRINQETGEYEYLWTLPIGDMNPDYKMALTYLPNADEYLFAATPNDLNMPTVYYRLDVESKIIAQTTQLVDSNVVTFFINTDEKDMEAPLRPEYVSMNFPEGALAGSFTFTMTSELAGGNAATENLTWTFYTDGEEITSGTAEPGASVEVNTEFTQGTHTIEMASAIGTHEGPSFKKQVYIGNDTPKAPTNVVLTEGNVTWDAVTEGVNNGYLNLDDMIYEVYINDEYIGETAETSLDFNVAPTDAFGKHTATVIAICNDIESEKGTSNSAVYGAPMTLDVFFGPNRDEASLFTVIKEDVENALAWGFDSWDEAFATDYAWKASNTWLVSPPVNMDDTNVVYAVEFDALTALTMNEDEAYMSVYVASDANADIEDAEKVLFEPYMPTMNEYTKYRAIFCISEASAKHIVFKAYSDYLAYQFKVRNISIAKTDLSPKAPSGVTNLEAIEAENGELKATVIFNMPLVDLTDNDLAADAEITATVTAGEEKSVVTGKPGEEMSAVIATVQGNNNIAVSVAIGEDAGETCNVNVYTGIDRPGMPKNFKAEIGEDPYTVNFSWEAPEGAQGKYFEAKDIKYSILYKSGWYTYDVGEIPVDATEFTFTFPDGTDQNQYTFYINATNEIGEGAYATYDLIAGKPYELPMVENFEGNRYTYYPFVLTYPSEDYIGSGAIFQAPYYTNELFEKYDHPCVTALSTIDGDVKSRLAFPMFTTENISGTVVIRLEVWTGDLSAETMTLYGNSYFTEEPIEIGTIEKGTGWTEVNFTLPDELLGKQWCELYLDSEYRMADTYTMVYSYSIETTTGVDTIASQGGTIRALKGSVTLNGLQGASYSIFTLDGRIVKSGVAESNQYCVSIAPGTYIVRVADKTAKVIVR